MDSNQRNVPALPSPSGIVTLTTDFGTEDGYVGVMKGVLYTVNPACTPVDITHAVAPQDIQGGGFQLSGAYPFFPAGTVHLAVVDPGVGSERRPLVVVAANHFFVGPDNGLFSTILQSSSAQICIEITDSSYLLPDRSSTFHGRDVFAPVAAHLSRGVSPLAMGSSVDDPVILSSPEPATAPDGSLQGSVIHIDHFGNLITNISADMVRAPGRGKRRQLDLGTIVIRQFVGSYAEAADGELLCIIGSRGMLEICIRNGSAEEATGVQCGQRVTLSAFEQ